MFKPFGKDIPFFVAVPAFLWQILFFYLPVLLILFLSFFKIGFTLEVYKYFLNVTYLTIVFKSILFALLNAIICFIIGYPVAYFISFKAGRHKNTFLFLLILPFWTNFLLHIYSWSFILKNISSSLLYTKFSVALVMLYCYLPFMILPIYSILQTLDKRLIEISLDLGATIFYTWRKIMLPLTFSGIKSGFFLVLVPSFTEFVIPGLMGGEKYVFVGSVISDYILGDKTISYGAAFTSISCFIFIIVILLLQYVITKLLKIREIK